MQGRRDDEGSWGGIGAQDRGQGAGLAMGCTGNAAWMATLQTTTLMGKQLGCRVTPQEDNRTKQRGARSICPWFRRLWTSFSLKKKANKKFLSKPIPYEEQVLRGKHHEYVPQEKIESLALFLAAGG
eukprot:Gb_34254 [translate_table: standard]